MGLGGGVIGRGEAETVDFPCPNHDQRDSQEEPEKQPEPLTHTGKLFLSYHAAEGSGIRWHHEDV